MAACSAQLASAQQQRQCLRGSSLRRSGGCTGVAVPLRAAPGARRSRFTSSVVVRAESNRGGDSLARTVDTMLKRYDFVSTGMGALCVTGWFWSHGQPPLEALSIAACSTIVALVVNELVFTNK